MATTIGALRVELSANIAKFEAAMGNAAKNMARTQRSFERFGSRASAAGRSLSIGLTAPLVAVGALAAKSFLSFEQGMNKVAAVSGATEADMAELTATAKDLGATTSFSAAQAAEGLGFLAQAGFDATEAGRALPGVLQLAAAGGIQLAEAADIATNVLAGYGLEVDQLARVNDVLAKASSSANTDVLQLGQAFKFAGPVARSAGISFEQSGAAMALMGNAGIQAEMAGTALRGAITKLVNPSKEAATTMAELGISATDSEGRLRPLDEIIEQLAPHADNTGAIMQIFGQRAGPAMAALVSQGADALREMTTALEQSGGTAQEIADKKLAGLTGAWTRLQSATEGVFIEIGSRLSPVLERLAATITDRILPAVRDALDAFGRLSPEVQTSRILWLGFAAALGPALIAVGGVTAALTPLLPLLSGVWRGAGRVSNAILMLIPNLRTAGASAAAFGARLKRLHLTNMARGFKLLGISSRGAGVGLRLAAVAAGGLRLALRGIVRALGPLAVIWAAFEFAAWAAGALKLGDKLKRLVGITDDAANAADRADQQWAEFSTTLDTTRAALDETTQQIDALTRKHERLTEQLERAQTQNRRSISGIKNRIAALEEEIETVERLHDERVKDVQFGEFLAPLAALAAKDLEMWAAASREAKTAARELGVELSVAVKMDHLTRAVHTFAETGALTTIVMREIGTQAAALGVPLEDLPPELKNIVTWLNRTTAAAAEAEPKVDELGGAIGETGDAAQTAREPLQGLVDDVFSVEAAAKRSRDALANLIKTQGLVGSQQFGRVLPSTPLSIDTLGVTVPVLVTPEFDLRTVAQTFADFGKRFQAFGTHLSQTFVRAFEGGGGVAGALGALGTQVLSGFGDIATKAFGESSKVRTLLSGGLFAAIPGIGPFLSAFGGPLLKGLGALGKKIGGVFKRIFGGPSEAELAGRQAWRSYADGLAAEANAEQIQQALGAGWANVEDAKAWIVLRDSVQKAGGSAAEAEGLWQRYVAAIKQGPEAVAAVTHELDGWRQKAGEVAQAETEIAARNKELAGSLAGLVEAGHAAFDPAQLDPYLSQMQELGLITAEEAASMRQLADDAHVDWRGMEAAAKQYGVGMKTVLDESGREVQVLDESLLGLGHAQAKLTDEGGQLASAWALLTDEGGHMQAAIEGMTDEAQVFVTRALEMGIALPAAMKPMLEAMVEQGRLTDQNGEKLEDLSGLTFADPIAAQFDRLADSIQMLIIALGGPSGLSQAVEDMVDSAGLEIEDLAGEWAGMTEEAKAQFGSFAAFVEDQALRQIASAAGVKYDEIAAKWEAMTDEEKAAFESFAAFLDEQALKKLVDDAGEHYDDLEQKWTDMTKAQRGAIGSFRAFVNAELAKINDRTVTVTTQHQTEGFPSGGDEPVFGARHGTPFRQFGRGTPAMLHGLERVMTAGEGRGIQAALGRITGGLAAIADLSGITSLAQGGLVTHPLIAQLHPPEAVVPLDRMAEFGGGSRVEAKLDQLHQDFALLLDEFRHGLDPRRRARAVVAAAALSTT